MKAGMVAQIRVNPKDCQSILDMMGVLGIDPYDGRSFAQCVSLALSSALHGMRTNRILPEVDPFQYLNRMGPFLQSRNNKRKANMAEMLYQRAMATGGVVAPVMPIMENPKPFLPEHLENLRTAQQGWTSSGPSDTAAVPMQLDDATRELLGEELDALYQRLNKGDELSPAEKQRFDDLNKTLFG